MSEQTPATDSDQILDVRGMRKPDKHPTIFATFTDLAVGGSFVLVNDHDPKHLHEEFEAEWPGGYDWEYLNQEMRDWQIRITRRASAPTPRLLGQADELGGKPGVDGAVWRLGGRDRDLDASVLEVAPGVALDPHRGPGTDVLVHVLSGDGVLVTEVGQIPLSSGVLLHVPAGATRGFTAGDNGLRALLVQQRRQELELGR